MLTFYINTSHRPRLDLFIYITNAVFRKAVYCSHLKEFPLLQKNCPHIVVATPGRLLALSRQKTLNLNKIKFFILDECDKMLGDLGKEGLTWNYFS